MGFGGKSSGRKEFDTGSSQGNRRRGSNGVRTTNEPHDNVNLYLGRNTLQFHLRFASWSCPGLDVSRRV